MNGVYIQPADTVKAPVWFHKAGVFPSGMQELVGFPGKLLDLDGYPGLSP